MTVNDTLETTVIVNGLQHRNCGGQTCCGIYLAGLVAGDKGVAPENEENADFCPDCYPSCPHCGAPTGPEHLCAQVNPD